MVKSYHKNITDYYDPNAQKCGFPDKFVYKIVDDYLWMNSCSLSIVSNVMKRY